MNILTFIPSYGMGNFNYLKNTIEHLQRIEGHEFHIILYTTEGHEFDNVVTKVYPDNIKRMLVHEYKADLLRHIDDFDMFLYLEDDMLLTEENLQTFIDENDKVKDDYVIGFLRYEPKDGEKYLNEMAQIYPIDFKFYELNGERYFSFSNVHQGSFAFLQSQMKKFIEDGKFIIDFRLTLEDAASNFFKSTIFPGTMKGIEKIYPVNALDKLLIHHQSNKHTGIEFFATYNFMPLSKLKEKIK